MPETVYATQPGAVTEIWRRPSPRARRVTSGGDDREHRRLHLHSLHAAGGGLGLHGENAEAHVLDRRTLHPARPSPSASPPIASKGYKVVYSDRFPQFTPLVQVGANQVRREFPYDGTQSGPIAITNTLWYRSHAEFKLRAYNIQDRRVFVEFLGDKRGQSGSRISIISSVMDRGSHPARPRMFSAELGELLTPFQGDAPEGSPKLFADPIPTVGQNSPSGTACRSTPGSNTSPFAKPGIQDDYQMHWMEESLQGAALALSLRALGWSGQTTWPEIATLCGLVDTEEQAKATAVPLPAQNAPRSPFGIARPAPRQTHRKLRLLYLVDPAISGASRAASSARGICPLQANLFLARSGAARWPRSANRRLITTCWWAVPVSSTASRPNLTWIGEILGLLFGISARCSLCAISPRPAKSSPIRSFGPTFSPPIPRHQLPQRRRQRKLHGRHRLSRFRHRR